MKLVSDIQKSLGSIAKGMGITIKYFFRKPVTQQFPQERWVLPERFRGFVHNDIPRCTSCMLCAKACPVDCIYIEMEGKGKERMMSRYAIDYNKCIWCALCTEQCPTNCITMSHDYDHAVYTRGRLVYEYVDEPVVPYKVPKKPKPPAKPASDKPAAPAASDKPAAPAASDKPAAPAASDKPAAPAASDKPAAPAASDGASAKDAPAENKPTPPAAPEPKEPPAPKKPPAPEEGNA